MRTLIIILLLGSTVTFAQQTKEWVDNLENPEYQSSKLGEHNLLSKYVRHDFSELLMPKSVFLGYIGSQYQRIHIYFDTIEKSEKVSSLYFVTGHSIVNDNKCDFQGTLTIDQVREFENMHYGVDNMYKNDGIQSQGLIIAKYRFSENPEQKHVGIFDGIMTLWWFVDKNGKVQIDNLENHSDSYKNNQFVGSWTEYGKNGSRSCNWGEFRIPFSGDLDVGAGEFSVNSKYYKQGWQDYDIY